jgi:hypothetical protein
MYKTLHALAIYERGLQMEAADPMAMELLTPAVRHDDSRFQIQIQAIRTIREIVFVDKWRTS